jgi:hypothetical protein
MPMQRERREKRDDNNKNNKYDNNSPEWAKNYLVVLVCGADDGASGGAGSVSYRAVSRERQRYAVFSGKMAMITMVVADESGGNQPDCGERQAWRRVQQWGQQEKATQGRKTIGSLTAGWLLFFFVVVFVVVCDFGRGGGDRGCRGLAAGAEVFGVGRRMSAGGEPAANFVFAVGPGGSLSLEA